MPFANRIFSYMQKLNDICHPPSSSSAIVSHSRGSMTVDLSQRLSILFLIESHIMSTLKVPLPSSPHSVFHSQHGVHHSDAHKAVHDGGLLHGSREPPSADRRQSVDAGVLLLFLPRAAQRRVEAHLGLHDAGLSREGGADEHHGGGHFLADSSLSADAGRAARLRSRRSRTAGQRDAERGDEGDYGGGTHATEQAAEGAERGDEVW